MSIDSYQKFISGEFLIGDKTLLADQARVEMAYMKSTVFVHLNLYSSEEVYHVTVARFHFQAYRIQLELALFL